MPRETLATQPMLLALDATARRRTAELIPHVQKAYHRHEERAYGRAGPADVDDAYVHTVATGVGLNHWMTARTMPPATIFVPAQRGEDVELVPVHVLGSDVLRAGALASYLHVPLPNVLGAAVCTGLGTLLGSLAVEGPFEAPDA
jgi:hypothetical protein